MQNEKRESFAIAVYLLTGIVGVPAAIYQLTLNMRSGWVCYSKHGHILETVAGCKFNLYSGLFIATGALAIGLYQVWERR